MYGAGGAAGPPPKKIWATKLLRFFGQREEFGQSRFLEKFACVCVLIFFFRREIFFIFKLKSAGESQLNSHETVVA